MELSRKREPLGEHLELIVSALRLPRLPLPHPPPTERFPAAQAATLNVPIFQARSRNVGQPNTPHTEARVEKPELAE